MAAIEFIETKDENISPNSVIFLGPPLPLIRLLALCLCQLLSEN